MRQRLAALTAALALCATLAAADDPTKGRPTVEVVRVEVNKKHDKTVPYSYTGISVSLEVRQPGKQVLGLDPSSAVSEFKDDKGTSLLFPGIFKTQFSQMAVAKDHSGMTVAVFRNGAAPAKGATKISLKGTLVLVCGLDPKETEEKEIEFKANTTVKTGDYTVKVTGEKGFGSAGAFFTITSAAANMTLSSVTVKDADGKAVEVTPMGHYGYSKHWVYSYGLKKVMPKGKISVNYFSKEEKATVPVDVSFGVGL
jgi:hypothetical protein